MEFGKTGVANGKLQIFSGTSTKERRLGLASGTGSVAGGGTDDGGIVQNAEVFCIARTVGKRLKSANI